MTELTFDDASYTWLLFWITYWVSGIVLTYINRKERPPIKLFEVITSAVMNMGWTFIGIVIVHYLPIRIINDYNIIIKYLLSILIAEVWFYHAHIMVHHPQLYQKIHKQHHEFTNNVYALTALYCSGYEAVVCNLLSVSIGPLMLGIRGWYLYFWIILISFNAVFSHSGMVIDWVNNGSHDLHHASYTYNYGTIGLFDWIYGTYKSQ